MDREKAEVDSDGVESQGAGVLGELGGKEGDRDRGRKH